MNFHILCWHFTYSIILLEKLIFVKRSQCRRSQNTKMNEIYKNVLIFVIRSMTERKYFNCLWCCFSICQFSFFYLIGTPLFSKSLPWMLYTLLVPNHHIPIVWLYIHVCIKSWLNCFGKGKIWFISSIHTATQIAYRRGWITIESKIFCYFLRGGREFLYIHI